MPFPARPARLRRARRVVLGVAALALVTAGLAGCGIRIPTDPNGTLDRVDGAVLRVGASPSDGLVETTGGEVGGALADIVDDFADSRGAEVRWTVGSEEDLVAALEEGDLDLAIGGMTPDTPWADRVSVTRAFDALPGTAGREVVMLLPLGENALQQALETFLDREAAS